MMDRQELDNFTSPSIVSSYDARPAYPFRIVKALQKKRLLQNGDRVADIGTGTGRVPELLFNSKTHLAFQVIGVDPSEAMLSIARDKFPDSSFRAGKFEALPLLNNSTDVLIGGSSWHWGVREKAQRNKTEAETKRVLTKDGRIISLIDGWCSADRFDLFSRFLDRMQSLLAEKYINPDFNFTIKNICIRQLEKETLYGKGEEKTFNRAFFTQAVRLLHLDNIINPKKDFLASSYASPIETSVEGIITEFRSQVYFDTLASSEKEQVIEAIDSAAEYHNNEKITCGRKTTVIAGYGYGY